MPVVLDASALLALLRDEDGAELVATLLTAAEKDASGARGLLSTVNATEVLQVATPAASAGVFATGSPIAVVPYTVEHARKAAEFRESTRDLGLSLADRACLALGYVTNSVVLTADGPMCESNVGVTVRHVRPRPSR